ncbi:Transaldolase [Cyphellophora attinorum]|uniref:Transaldolase n=1 Tax=Cyphellophora attinorum TaxID=1664694 RepID=A0A0N1H9A6_9EURO|nr:Transaldolase [Phialophora attinorum]KPI40124.1 Transaldolase [Phialophora attinorum]
MNETTDQDQAHTWLDVMNERLNVDIDWMDPEFIKSLPSKPYDQTSNQLWMGIQLAHTTNRELLARTARELIDSGWLAVYTKMGTIMCKENMARIRGRVLVQTSPAQAYDVEATVNHAREYAREFKIRGISEERFCIKIPATGPGVLAMRKLSAEGIPVLGTAVFSVEQAIACSQAGCLYISPYFNEVRSHEDPSLWPDVEDPAVQHPFSHRIYQMTQAFKQLHEKTGMPQPLIKLAAFRHIREVIAASELGCHSVTVSAAMMRELADTNYSRELDRGQHRSKSTPDRFYDSLPQPSERLRTLLASDPLTSRPGQFEQAEIDVDYLANNAAALSAALHRDTAGRRRLEDAINMFIKAEAASQQLIESTVLDPVRGDSVL